MQTAPPDLRDIPILTDAVEEVTAAPPEAASEELCAAISSATLQLADALLRQAAKDIEATLFERVFDELRAQLPDLVDRIVREHTVAREHPHDHG